MTGETFTLTYLADHDRFFAGVREHAARCGGNLMMDDPDSGSITVGVDPWLLVLDVARNRDGGVTVADRVPVGHDQGGGARHAVKIFDHYLLACLGEWRNNMGAPSTPRQIPSDADDPDRPGPTSVTAAAAAGRDASAASSQDHGGLPTVLRRIRLAGCVGAVVVLVIALLALDGATSLLVGAGAVVLFIVSNPKMAFSCPSCGRWMVTFSTSCGHCGRPVGR